jgi:hypothetical protein
VSIYYVNEKIDAVNCINAFRDLPGLLIVLLHAESTAELLLCSEIEDGTITRSSESADGSIIPA